ncbi:hypothetical protein PPERSA_11445 [Pseudocohnilembus persalinus]|uniref:Uncharacterized protein n=1 Tax=Pseudocohnilembus persalinus TaxID=266149 RepID=A0A0V0QXN6_PSEPJ|nr:hypothetical protein PPERSA_11445 [Pseudocohnilembus persalinus]|eukprot:KRX06800.1 hypothetical protein PPERSA_11445 [Pseudocohnilembus persalinus]
MIYNNNKNFILNSQQNQSLISQKRDENFSQKQNSNFSSNSNSKPLLLVMNIDLGQNESDAIEIYEDSDAEQIAIKFCLKHNLAQEAIEILRKNIEQNIEKLLNKIENENENENQQCDNQQQNWQNESNQQDIQNQIIEQSFSNQYDQLTYIGDINFYNNQQNQNNCQQEQQFSQNNYLQQQNNFYQNQNKNELQKLEKLNQEQNRLENEYKQIEKEQYSPNFNIKDEQNLKKNLNMPFQKMPQFIKKQENDQQNGNRIHRSTSQIIGNQENQKEQNVFYKQQLEMLKKNIQNINNKLEKQNGNDDQGFSPKHPQKNQQFQHIQTQGEDNDEQYRSKQSKSSIFDRLHNDAKVKQVKKEKALQEQVQNTSLSQYSTMGSKQSNLSGRRQINKNGIQQNVNIGEYLFQLGVCQEEKKKQEFAKIQEQKQNEENSKYSFQPQINDVSQQIVDFKKQYKQNSIIEDQLLHLGKIMGYKKEVLRNNKVIKERQQYTFQPQVNLVQKN